MNKIAIITDTHWGARNDSVAFLDYYDKFYTNIFFPYLKEHGIKEILHLGDIFDRRKFINFNTLDRAREIFFDKLVSEDVVMHLVIGNHDTYFKNTNEINSPDLLLGEYKSHIKIYSKPEIVSFGNTDILLMPWMCTDNMEESLNIINNPKSAQVCMGHLELAGFEMNKGIVIEHGMDSNIFGRFDLVCSGHFHHRSKKGNIRYLGCPYEITWSDYGDQKGFHSFNTDTRELDFVHNPYTMFNKIHYDDSMWKDYGAIDTLDFSDLSGTYVKVIVNTKNNPYWFDLFIDRLEKVDPLAIQVVDDNLYLNLEDDGDIVNEAEDTLSILKKFVESAEVDIDKKEIDKILGELYVEALSI